MKQEILDGNKLIAEFMGAEWKQDDYNEWGYLFPDKSPGFPDWNKFRQIESLKYHTSWDWIMPVVEMIAENIYSKKGCIGDNWVNCFGLSDVFKELQKHTHHSVGFISDMETTWIAVVEFIKWHKEKSILTTLNP